MKNQSEESLRFDPVGIKARLEDVLNQVQMNPGLSQEERFIMGTCFHSLEEWMEKEGDRKVEEALIRAFILGRRLSERPLPTNEEMVSQIRDYFSKTKKEEQ